MYLPVNQRTREIPCRPGVKSVARDEADSARARTVGLGHDDSIMAFVSDVDREPVWSNGQG